MAVKCGKVLGACVSHPEIVTRAAPTNLAVPTIWNLWSWVVFWQLDYEGNNLDKNVCD